MQLERVLVPTDFSEASGCALPHAFEIARRFEAQMTMVHIRTPFSGDSGQPENSFFDEEKHEEYAAAELEQILRQVGPDLQVNTLLKRDLSAASGILECVEEHSIDLVVMGAHGRSALAHFFLGSVAEKVVRHSTVPVITVAPSRPDYRQDPVYRKMLATFDFSRHSKEAVKGARGMACKYEAALQVLYVIEQEVHLGYHKTWKESMAKDLPEIEAEARKSLIETLGEEEFEDIELCVKVGTGDGKAYSEISRFAEESEVDLIIMGTHGLSGFQHMLLGSTTERVIRTAPFPVLTFHLGDSEAG